jgi:Sister chromatid cohesion C-terminus
MWSLLRRGGLVAPWTAVPALVALATDPQRDVSEASLRLLRQQVQHRAARSSLPCDE